MSSTGEFLKTIVLFAAAMLLSSCVDNTYDLSENINKDITLWSEGFSIPIGSTEKIRLIEFLEPSGSLTLDQDSVYSIHLEGDLCERNVGFPVTNLSFEKVLFDPASLTPVTDPTGSLGSGPASARFETESRIGLNCFVPNEAQRIKSVFPYGNNPEMFVNISFSRQIKAALDNIIFTELRIQFPEFLRFSEKSGVAEDNSVILYNQPASTADGFLLTLPLEGIDFTAISKDGIACEKDQQGIRRLIIDKDNEIDIRGIVRPDEGHILPSSLSGMEICSEISCEDLTLGTIEGLFDLGIEPVKLKFKTGLGDNASLLEESLSFELSNPRVGLDVTNTTGVPIVLTAKLYGVDESGKVIDGSSVQDIELKLKATAKNEKEAVSRFIISREEIRDSGTDTENIVRDDIQNLLKHIPSGIAIELDIESDQEQDHRIDLSPKARNEIISSYFLDIPLSFYKISVNHTELFNDFKKTLKDIPEGQRDLELTISGQVINTLPTGLTFGLTATGIDGENLSGVKSSEIIIPQTGINPQGVSVLLTIDEGYLPKINVLNLSIKGQIDSETPQSLKASDYIQALDLKARLTGGVSFNLDKL